MYAWNAAHLYLAQVHWKGVLLRLGIQLGLKSRFAQRIPHVPLVSHCSRLVAEDQCYELVVWNVMRAILEPKEVWGKLSQLEKFGGAIV